MESVDKDEKYYLDKLEKNPSDDRALFGFASYLTSNDRLVEAENIYQRLLALPFHGRSDEHADSLYAYGTFLWQTDRSDKAENTFQMGLKFNKEHLGILRNLGLAMFARGAYAAAGERFQRASLLCPADTLVKLALVICLEHLGNAEQKEIDKLYQDIFRMHPAYPAALFSYALFLKGQDQRELAIEYYEKTLALTPNDTTVLCSYGVCLSEAAFHR